MDLVLLLLATIAIAIGVPILALIAFRNSRQNRTHLFDLRARLEKLSRQLEGLRNEVQSLRSKLDIPPEETTGEPHPRMPAEVRPAATRIPAVPEPWGAARPSEPTPEERIPSEAGEEEHEVPAVPGRAAEQPIKPGLEETLASRWLVWLGAVTIALAGTFLVKFAIEQGWLGPAVRDALGLSLGIALSIGGEWLRRRPLQRAIAAVRPNYVPPALTASGIFTIFVSIYAAHGLHHFLTPLTAFLALGFVALAAFGLSLLQGWFVAFLGLLGGFLTPGLVESDRPEAWVLFPYLLVILTTYQAVVRYTGWHWLSVASLFGAFCWPAIWLLSRYGSADLIPVSLYLFLASSVFLFLRHYADTSGRPSAWVHEMAALSLPEKVSWAATCLFAVFVFVLVRLEVYSIDARVLLGAFCIYCLLIGRREQAFDGFGTLAAVIMTLAMTAWHLPELITYPEPAYRMEGQAYGRIPGPVVPPELLPFVLTATFYGALFGAGGFVSLWGAKRPAMWAGLSAATPVILLVLAYWRIVDFNVDLRWASAALGLAVLALAACFRVARYHDARLLTPLGFYSAAVVSCVSLGATMTLREAWLTVALSIQLPALGWIGKRVAIRPMSTLALIVAAIVLVRLVLNYNVLDYSLGSKPVLSWVIYGYGIPAMMFYWAARIFRRLDVQLLVTLLEAGALAFLVLLVSLQIRIFITGSIDAPDYNLTEQSLQSTAWLCISYVLYSRYTLTGNRVCFWGSRILLVLSIAQVTLLQLILSNPVVTGEFVGQYPVMNLLFIAYVVPAVFCFAFTVILRGTVGTAYANATGALGFILIFAYISLEVTHIFQGPYLSPFPESDGEFYSYSAAWLLYAGGLLGLGIYNKIHALRYASLVVLLITILKVFILDMGGLTGLYRVASFLGLGLALVAIGYLYQRFVFPIGRGSASDTKSEGT